MSTNEKEIKDITIKEGVSEIEIISKNSFFMDINIIELPLTSFNKKNPNETNVAELKKRTNLSPVAKKVLASSNDGLPAILMSWTDSKNNYKELLAISSSNKLVTPASLEVLYALVRLYVLKNSPIKKINNRFILENNKLDFSMYELCEVMGLVKSGNNADTLQTKIRELENMSFYSLGTGVFFDKETNKYVITTDEKSIKFINSHKFAKRGEKTKCWVEFGDLLMSNIRNSFVKFLNEPLYFKLKSGLERRIYTYIAGNKNARKREGGTVYLKRHMETLGRKLPYSYTYISKFKERLKKPLNSLIKEGVIKDYFYGDKEIINGVKEKCIYFIFEGSKEELVKKLNKSKDVDLKTQEVNQSKYSLIPQDKLEDELINIGVKDSKIHKILSTYDYWKINSYLLWVNNRAGKKPTNPSGLFLFAIEGGVDLKTSMPDLYEFIDTMRKIKRKDSEKEKLETLEKYEKYLDNRFTRETIINEYGEEFYQDIANKLKLDIEKTIERSVRNTRKLYDMAAREDEKEKLLNQIKEMENYFIDEEESSYFKKHLAKRIKGNLIEYMSLSEFKKSLKKSE